MSLVQAFKWNDKDYFYSPDHHKIFLSSRIPVISVRPPLVNPTDIHINTLFLNISEGCNLNCEYCFTPPRDPCDSKMMSEEIARGAVMKLSEWRSKRIAKPACIVFFGGEPFINRDLLEYVIHFSQEWGREFKIPFVYSVSTNATLLTSHDINLLNREHVFLWVSIDGPAEIHDRYRHFRNISSGSHAVAIKNALHALEILGPDRIGIRATLSTGIRELSKIIEYFALLGFRIIAIKPVDSNFKQEDFNQKQDAKTLTNNIDKCTTEILRWIPFGLQCSPFNRDMRSLKTGHIGRFVCEAGSGSLTVDVEGWVYPCHRFVGNPRFKLGHIRGEICLESCRDFAALNILNLIKCKECWARKFCLGCCPGASVASGNALGYANHQTCEERKAFAIISLKCAAARGLVSR